MGTLGSRKRLQRTHREDQTCRSWRRRSSLHVKKLLAPSRPAKVRCTLEEATGPSDGLIIYTTAICWASIHRCGVRAVSWSSRGRGWSDKKFGLTGVLFPSGFIALVRAGTRAERNKNATIGEGDGGRAIARSWVICDNRDVRFAAAIRRGLDGRIVVADPHTCPLLARLASKSISPT